MLLKGWAAAQRGPQQFDLASEGAAVRARYRQLGKTPQTGDTRQLDAVIDIALNAGAERVYVDRPYVDFDYRSDHSHYYGRAFRPPPEAAERLIFRSGENVVGVSVMRPLPRPVGRTVLAPPIQRARYVTCLARQTVHAFGYEWHVDGYPFTSQDGQYARCAHAAIWSIARYHHLRFKTERHTISGIIDAAGLRERPDKTAPSNGMYASDIAAAFRNIGLPALQYDIAEISQTLGEEPHDVIRRYLNSGIPVGVQVANHMIVLVGYGETRDGNAFYIVSDDNCGPYEQRSLVKSGPEKWNLLMIPLPGRMHVAGDTAEIRAQQAFSDRIRDQQELAPLLERWRDRPGTTEPLAGRAGEPRDGPIPLEVHTYATPSADYVRRLRRRGVPDDLRNHHVFAPKANWLWITEFHDADEAPQRRVLGEIAVDATSIQLDPEPLFGNIDGFAYIWERDDNTPNIASICPGARYASALSDHSQVDAPDVRTLAGDEDDVEPVDLDQDGDPAP